jgi:hypothetical protein
MRSPAKLDTYRLFRNQRREGLHCAVPPGVPLPSFLTGEPWHELAPLLGSHERPPGFSDTAAAFSCDCQNFYVFRWQRPSVIAPAGDERAA